MNILLIEDDKRISDFVIKGLEENGFSVTLAVTGEIAREMISESEWDIILMDIMLPGIDGIQLTKLIRFKKNHTPILVLSALDDADDKVSALDSGADDYLVKPFHFKELISRINALTRRTKFNYKEKEQVYVCHNLTVNLDEHSVFQEEQPIDLSPREYKLLLFLLENKNKVVSRTQLLNAVWGINYDNNTNVVDVYISYLRNKIDENQHKFIHTIKGTGYMLKE
ncbi:Transcriptional activator protein CzcR [compost metagenome]|jgi:Response regulators consisting of a CheY-like receiver domain and a winged-helix DNA-binding domain|uniref:DNA-binding response OmpR family regulator n=1 Tax=Flavobacterium endophyticum TaxID=1540163 RepID=A0A495M3D7_9FLAO|nr:response regulator transcription factor [Flavobacterium endophyticum]RKS20514.1 DNA-binding response OmpR family regulator [Flavobacterium endophyticum]